MTERRSDRAKSNINYSKYVCDDDDDFADPTPPMKKLKKNKENCNQSVQLKEKLQTKDKKSKSRKPPPEDRLLELQIKEALAASLKETCHNKNDSVVEDDKDAQTVVKEVEDSFIHKPISTLTQKDPDKNSKVKTGDEIEIISSTTVSHSPPRKRQKTSRFNCIDSDSDDDKDSTFAAESDDSDDEEFGPDGDDNDDFNSHKKSQDKSKKRTNQVKTKQVNKEPVPNSSTKTPKSTKSVSKLTPKSTTIPSTNTSGSSATASSVTTKSTALSRTPVSQPRKIPSWTPPGPADKSSQSSNMKSPGGIRIGLSRQQRVKTLHPSLTVQH